MNSVTNSVLNSAINRTILLIAILLSPPLACAEIYKWLDEDGKVHFGDKKPRNQEAESVVLEINTYTNVTYDTAIFDHGARYGARKVVMYSAKWCGVCKKAKRFFQENAIAFTEYDIDESEANKKRYKRLNARGVPVIFVGKNRMNGFSEAGFRRIYQ